MIDKLSNLIKTSTVSVATDKEISIIILFLFIGKRNRL